MDSVYSTRLRRRIEKYQKAQRLWEEGLSTRQIGKRLDIPHSTIWSWVATDQSPEGIVSCLKRVQLEPTEDFGHLCGLVLGDGYVFAKKSRNYGIGVATTDPELRELFSQLVESFSLTPITYERKDEREKWGKKYVQTVLECETNSKTMYSFFNEIKLNDHRWIYPEEMDCEEFRKGFLRGMFDAEGTINLSEREKRRLPHPRIWFGQKHSECVNVICNLLQQLEIESNVYREPDFFRLDIYRINSVRRFYTQVNFGLPRKKKKLEEYAELRGWETS